jgi:hypothetical protein
MLNIFKKQIPAQKGREVEVVELWRVEWESRYGSYSGDTRKEVEIFTNEPDAQAYAKALRDAFKIIRYKSGTDVKCYFYNQAK